MMRRKNLPILILVLAGGFFLAFRTLGFSGTPPTKYERILHNVGEMLEDIHYSPKEIDDNFSKEVFKKYLAEVDAEKDVFLQSDIQSLRVFETKIDDEILGKAPIQFVPSVSEIYKKRLLETEAIYKDLLSRPFDFSQDETVSMNYEKMDFPKDAAARQDAWRKRLKLLALERYSDLLDQQEKDKAKQGFVPKSKDQMEKEARDKVMSVMDRVYVRLKFKTNDDDRFYQFVQTIVQSMDPHTDYFPPVEKRSFDEQMSGRFFGIGASLLPTDDGGIKIATLMTGSPAWKSGQVNQGDVILKVAQGNLEPVDLTGFTVEDAVKLIRGNKGTEVRLTLKKSDGSVKTVSLIRDEIVLEETFARSVIVNSDKGKIGYIYLPEFYADFDNPKGNRCSIDVAKELIKLKEQNVDGVILDLRTNGGGFLYDVVQMAGLFIDEGPVVQVKDRDGKPQILRDHDKSVLYDGPFAVMVNELSASASEIFAAAIQDYKRGVIIGSTSTYGKGTVQRNIGLDRNGSFSDTNSSLGTVKLTLQKFYRVSGGSTQLRGVSSDVVLPDLYEYYKIREKDNPDALPWDEIPKADYTTWKYAYDVNRIKRESSDRIKNDQAFNIIAKDAEWLDKQQNDQAYPLSLSKYQDEQKQMRATEKQIETLSKLPAGAELHISILPADSTRLSGDKDRVDHYKQWLQGLKTDIWLDQAVKVVDDMVADKNMVYNK